MSKKHWAIGILSLVLALTLLVMPGTAGQSGLKISTQVTGDVAYQHVDYLSEVIGARVAGSEKEAETREYIVEQLEQMGYEVEVQPFSYTRKKVTYNSANVIATKPGRLDQTVLIGAHYDSFLSDPRDGQTSTGAGDNASGVGVMLEAAKVLAGYKTQGTIKFVAFGAEEVGLKGSRYFAGSMSQEDINNTVTMINLDCVGIGDYFYVYSGLDGNPGWARDLALKIGQGMGHDLRTSPQSEYFNYGTTGDWSDHVPFKDLGIPVAYFEWMNWDVYPNGGDETAQHGMIMHTGYDNLSFIKKDKLEKTAEVITALAFELSKNKLPETEKGKISQGEKYTSIQKRPGVNTEE